MTNKNKIKTPPEDRIYDDNDGFFLRAASVCVKDHNESEVLLVSSHSKPGRWIIPGGKIQANEDPGTSAAREAMEEAGARGRLGRTLGTFADPDRRHRTTVFVLHVDPENGGLVDDFEEKDHRLRRWFQIEEAKFILAKPLHAKYLKALEESSSLIRIPNNVKSTPAPFVAATTTNNTQQHHNGLTTTCSASSCSASACEKVNHLPCTANSRSIYGSQTTCGIQSASTMDSSSAYKSKLSTTDLANSVNLQVTNGIQATSSVPTSTKASATASGLFV